MASPPRDVLLPKRPRWRVGRGYLFPEGLGRGALPWWQWGRVRVYRNSWADVRARVTPGAYEVYYPVWTVVVWWGWCWWSIERMVQRALGPGDL